METFGIEMVAEVASEALGGVPGQGEALVVEETREERRYRKSQERLKRWRAKRREARNGGNVPTEATASPVGGSREEESGGGLEGDMGGDVPMALRAMRYVSEHPKAVPHESIRGEFRRLVLVYRKDWNGSVSDRQKFCQRLADLETAWLQKGKGVDSGGVIEKDVGAEAALAVLDRWLKEYKPKEQV